MSYKKKHVRITINEKSVGEKERVIVKPNIHIEEPLMVGNYWKYVRKEYKLHVN